MQYMEAATVQKETHSHHYTKNTKGNHNSTDTVATDNCEFYTMIILIL